MIELVQRVRRQHRPRAELFDPVKREIVGIMKIVSPAESVIVGGSAGNDDVLPVKLPINVLETMFPGFGVIKDNAVNVPMFSGRPMKSARARCGRRLGRGR